MDREIRSQLKKMIDNDAELRQHNNDFEVNNGAVTVKGDVASASEKTRVSDLVRAAPGVKDMVNALEIKPSKKQAELQQVRSAKYGVRRTKKPNEAARFRLRTSYFVLFTSMMWLDEPRHRFRDGRCQRPVRRWCDARGRNGFIRPRRPSRPHRDRSDRRPLVARSDGCRIAAPERARVRRLRSGSRRADGPIVPRRDRLCT